jgi:hypothetical protein
MKLLTRCLVQSIARAMNIEFKIVAVFPDLMCSRVETKRNVSVMKLLFFLLTLRSGVVIVFQLLLFVKPEFEVLL